MEQRIEKVEMEIERLKNRSNLTKDKSNWIAEISGSFKADVEFDEVRRFSREERRRSN